MMGFKMFETFPMPLPTTIIHYSSPHFVGLFFAVLCCCCCPTAGLQNLSAFDKHLTMQPVKLNLVSFIAELTVIKNLQIVILISFWIFFIKTKALNKNQMKVNHFCTSLIKRATCTTHSLDLKNHDVSLNLYYLILLVMWS